MHQQNDFVLDFLSAVVAAVVVGITMMGCVVLVVVVLVWCSLRMPKRAAAKQATLLSSPTSLKQELGTPLKEGDLEDVVPVVSSGKRPSYCYISDVSLF